MIDALKSVVKLIFKVILSVLISLMILLMIKAFVTEMSAILRLEDSFDTEIPLQSKIMAAIFHSTPCAVKERHENYNVFFDLDRYQYLLD